MWLSIVIQPWLFLYLSNIVDNFTSTSKSHGCIILPSPRLYHINHSLIYPFKYFTSMRLIQQRCDTSFATERKILAHSLYRLLLCHWWTGNVLSCITFCTLSTTIKFPIQNGQFLFDLSVSLKSLVILHFKNCQVLLSKLYEVPLVLLY